jgi:hypothetical protein
MAKPLIKGALLGGILLFIWGSLSWTLLPWHTMTMHRFSDEAAAVNALRANAPSSGIYVYPTPETPEEAAQAGPMVFLAYCTGGPGSMAKPMILNFLLQILVAGLVTALLLKTRGLTFWGRVGFVTLAAFTAGVVCFLPPWIWFKFATDYTLVMLADLTISGFLLGLVLAKWASPEPAAA